MALLPLRSDEFAEFLIVNAVIDMGKRYKREFCLIKGHGSPVDVQLHFV